MRVREATFEDAGTIAELNGRLAEEGLRLYVEEDNRRARRVYEALGMVQTSYRVYGRDWSRAFD